MGESLQTGGAARARITIGSRGEVDVDPSSEVRLIRARRSEHRLALDRGTMHARIWAPPLWFRVETPSAVAIDLGCAYTLSVDENGSGLLRVTMGWVAFEKDGRESFVPAGAVCRTRRATGPGTPVFEKASKALRASLDRFDFEALSADARRAELDVVLREAGPSDGLTLWHLLARTERDEAGRVFDRLAELVPHPPDVTREGIVRGDQGMLDSWWNALGLDDATWWRLWKREWSRIAS